MLSLMAQIALMPLMIINDYLYDHLDIISDY